jgi:hypothetical protein
VCHINNACEHKALSGDDKTKQIDLAVALVDHGLKLDPTNKNIEYNGVSSFLLFAPTRHLHLLTCFPTQKYVRNKAKVEKQLMSKAA